MRRPLAAVGVIGMLVVVPTPTTAAQTHPGGTRVWFTLPAAGGLEGGGGAR